MNKIELQERHYALVKAIVMAGDLLICNLFFLLACNVGGVDGLSSALQSHLLVSAVYFGCTVKGGIILHKKKVRNYQIAAIVLRNVFYFSIIASLLLGIGDFAMPARNLYVAYLFFMLAGITCFRICVRSLIKSYWKRRRHKNGVVFIGSTENNVALYHELADDPFIGYCACGYFDERPGKDFPAGCPYLGTLEEVIPYLEAHQAVVRNLYCCLPSKEKEDIRPVIRYCEGHLVRFYGVPEVRSYLYHHRMHFGMMGHVPCVGLHDEPLDWIGNRFAKRAFDIAFSLAFLCILFVPVLLVVALVTKLTMPGPVFFRQKRTGRNGREFYCLKFRSMKVNVDADRLQATKDDPRITRWGSIMRKTSIDELPQFINVLAGDMSVVGPRPHMVAHTEEYSKSIGEYMVRHFIKPGVTGWSQVNGFRGEIKELVQMEGRVKGDIWYIEHWSFWLDIYIIYKTVAGIIRGGENAF